MGAPDLAPFGRDGKSPVDIRVWVKTSFPAYSLLSFFLLGGGVSSQTWGSSEMTCFPGRWTRWWVKVLAEPAPPASREDAAYGSGRRAEMLKKK